LIAFAIVQEVSPIERTAALSRDDEGKVFAGVLVPILKAGAPNHDAVVEQGAVSFVQAVHLFYHVGELGNVESGNAATFLTFSGSLLEIVLHFVLVEPISARLLKPLDFLLKSNFCPVKSMPSCVLTQRAETARNASFSNYGSEGL
jgi:hypothetical protein